MNRTGYFTIVFLLFILIGAFIFYVQVQKEIQEEVLQTSLAANSLKVSSDTSYLDINGNPVSLKQYVGENVLAFAWASWCPSCGQQLQDLSKISKKYDDVTVLAFNRAEPKETVLNYLNFFGLIDTVELILDPTDHFFSSVGGYAMPEVIVFDTKGEIVYHRRGDVSEEELDTLLQQLSTEASQD